MFGKLKEAAAAGASAAVAAGTSAATAAKEKLDEGVAAKKMVDEGGEPVAEKLLAKKASGDSTVLDKQYMMKASQVISKYEQTIAQLQASASTAEGESPAFDTLIKAYGERAGAYKTSLAKLQDANGAPNALDVSNVEYHAINLVCVKKGLNGIGDGFGKMISDKEGTKSQAGGLFTSAKESAGSRLSVLGDRFSAAMPGKKLVDEGGEPVALKLLAKAATLEAVEMDKQLCLSLGKAVEAYKLAATRCEASVTAFPEEPFGKAGKEYTSRSELYNTVSSSLVDIPEVASMTPEEKNGALYADTVAAFSKAKDDITKSAQTAHGQAKQGYQAAQMAGQLAAAGAKK